MAAGVKKKSKVSFIPYQGIPEADTDFSRSVDVESEKGDASKAKNVLSVLKAGVFTSKNARGSSGLSPTSPSNVLLDSKEPLRGSNSSLTPLFKSGG